MIRFSLMLVMISLVATAPGAFADSPAAISKGGSSAESAFKKFAKDFMAKHYLMEKKDRSEPTVSRGTSQVTYRGFAEGYTVELRPTGHPTAPYVGLLRYKEHTYSCSGKDTKNCRIASTTPVTEIFRYQNGSWAY